MSDKQHGRATLEALGDGRFKLSGALDATTAGVLLKNSQEQFNQSGRIEIDLTGVAEADSAGLALLIEWVRMAKQAGAEVRFDHVPAQIAALARISEVEGLLFGTVTTETASA